MKIAFAVLSILIATVAYSTELPTSIEALIPRHANTSWHSQIGRSDHRICVFYYLPEIGKNDSIKYLEIFELKEDGSATQLSRIHLGGRGASIIDQIEGDEKVITIHAREHQKSDPISTPSKEVLITVKYTDIPILISKRYPKDGSNHSH